MTQVCIHIRVKEMRNLLVTITSVFPSSAAIIGTTSSLLKYIEENGGWFFLQVFHVCTVISGVPMDGLETNTSVFLKFN